jgi:D-alanyl-D-alanine carboxypeptidase/D-alanyl-D-alanine-endopeptidase (penicillin-binding protein 4)
MITNLDDRSKVEVPMKLFFCVLVFSFASPLMAVSKSQKAALEKSLSNLSQPVSQSIKVVRLRDGQVLFERNASQALIPASVTKIVTAAAILDHFPANKQFRTSFYYSGKRKDDRILGDLIVKGDGDPFIVSELLWQVAADMRHMGIREFTGNIVIDNSLFGGETRDKSRKFGKKSSRNAYDAPVSAFGINFNTFAVALYPNSQPGQPALASLDPYALKNVVLDNKIKTGKRGTSSVLKVNRFAKNHRDLIKATGSIPLNSIMVKKYRSVSDSLTTSGEYLRSFLEGAGITVRGKVVDGRVGNATKILDMYGYPVRKIVAGLNTFSNNYIADVMVKRLGAANPKSGKPDSEGQGTYENGLGAIEKFLKEKVGIKSSFAIKNGSGLSPDNQLSADQVIQILEHMEKDMRLFPEFIVSLPAAGWDGTMKKRFDENAEQSLHGRIRAKTGTLTSPVSVAGLAGYTRHPKHGLIAFCLIENGKAGSSQPRIDQLRDHQDTFLMKLLKE